MSWYDRIASFYDLSLEDLYRDARLASADTLELSHARRVLDLPTGTGASLDALFDRLPPSGRVVAVDMSAGMLKRAARRAANRGFGDRVELIESDVHKLEIEPFDRLHIFLGLSTFPRYEQAFERLWALLEPGGRAVVVDTYAEKPGLQGKLVNMVARADITRRVWEPLERVAEDFTRVELPKNWKHGGALFMSSGRKPR